MTKELAAAFELEAELVLRSAAESDDADALADAAEMFLAARKQSRQARAMSAVAASNRR